MPHKEFEIVFMYKGDTEERTIHPANRKAAEGDLKHLREKTFNLVCADLWERPIGDWKMISERVPVPGEEPL